MERQAEYTVPAPEYKKVHVNLPAALHQQVKTAAKAERRTMTQIITLAIEKYLEAKPKENEPNA